MRRHAGLIAIVGWMAGCAAGPTYHAPPAPVGAEGPFRSAAPAISGGETLPDHWWRLYDDATLDRLVVQALAANTDLRVAEANLHAAVAGLSAAKSGRLPDTGLGGSAVYGRAEIANLLAEDVGGKAHANWLDGLSFDMAYSIDLFGRIRYGVEAARADSEAAQAARDLVRVSVVAGTTAAYADICALGQSLDVAERSRALSERILKATALRHAAGVDTRLDLARAQALVAQTAAAIPPLEGQRRVSLFVLATLEGVTPAQLPPQLEACRTPLALRAPIPVGDGAALLRRRPDLRAAERNLAAATARVGIAASALYPSIVLAGSVGLNASRPSDFGHYSALSWGVGPAVSWSFPNRVAAHARIQAATSNATAALAGFDGAVIKALSEVEQALSVYRAEIDRHVALLAARDRSAEALRLASLERRDGALPYLDLLTAEQALIAADAALAASDRQLAADQVAVFKALGGGWRSADVKDGSGP